MICLEFRFPGGRFHASPWSRHINEGAIEWPPSPWRLCRALMATGFNRLGWSGLNAMPEEARCLFDKLADVLPTFELPPASAAHTRHYMPRETLANRSDEKREQGELLQLQPDLIIDTFAHVGREAILRVFWQVELDAAETALLRELLQSMPYLGRAESLVEATLAEGLDCGDAHANCRPWSDIDTSERQRCERVEMLAPMVPRDFSDWRSGMLKALQARKESEARAKAEKKGKQRTAKAWAEAWAEAWAKEQAKIAADCSRTLPADLAAALCQSSTEINSAGWNEPPGTRRVAYARPSDALNATDGDKSSARLPHACRPTTLLLALTSDSRHGDCLPLLKDAVLRADALHKAFVDKATKRGLVLTTLTGMTSDQSDVRRDHHRHLHLLPLVLNSQTPPDRPALARVDHFLLHAEEGFDDAALHVIRRTRRTWAKDLPDLFLTLALAGTRDDFHGELDALRPSRVWTSVTPFVPPRFLKRRGANSLRGQLLAEIRDRLLPNGLPLPDPISIEVELDTTAEAHRWLTLDSDESADAFWRRWRGMSESIDGRLSMRWRNFRLERPNAQRHPCVAMGFGLRLCFADPIPGPLALGYGAHFGLGCFEASDE